jgi:superoxide dismutase, Fe-Mn family
MQTRRKFIKNTGKGLVGVTLAGSLLDTGAAFASGANANRQLSFTQDKLPYSFGDLEPTIDAQTVEIHYTKHHTAYIKAVNEAIVTEHISETLQETLLANISKYSSKVRNNAGGAWNHNFFWESMAPKSSGPSGKLQEAITSTFGSLEKFKEQFATAATGRFGSGWAWLIENNGKLEIISTPNQDNPLMDVTEIKGKPLLGLDVWEHAYYLKYQNRRLDYITNWWNVVNWEKVAGRLG